MQKFKSQSLEDYLDALSAREPVPGGGSAAALAAALGAGLISKVARYSLGRGLPLNTERRIRRLLRRSEEIRRRLLKLVDLDARAYLAVVKARPAPAPRRKAALRRAAAVPKEVSRLCRSALGLTPFLVRSGNPNLLSDIEVARAMLFAGHQSALVNVAVNQPKRKAGGK